MRRDPCVGYHDGLAAGAGKPHRVPVVVNGIVGFRHQEEAGLRPVRQRHDAADDAPGGIVDAACEAPAPAQPVAAALGDGLAGRRIGDRGNGVETVLPEIVLRLVRIASDHPGMHGAEAVDPAGGAVAACNSGYRFDEHVVTIFEAAEALRLHDAEQFLLAHHVDEIGRDLSRLFELGRALARNRADLRCASQQFGDAGGDDSSGCCSKCHVKTSLAYFP